MTLPAQVLKGVRSFAKLSLRTIFKQGNEVLPPYTNAGAPTNGTSGTLAGVAEPGALLIDTTNKTLYQNSNTKASPTWTIFTTASGSGAFTGTFDGVVGGVTPAAATATTLHATGAVTADTTLAVTGLTKLSAANAITAHSGGGQGSAVALTKTFNNVTVSGADTDSVKLPAATAGSVVVIFNADAAQKINVFPSTGDTIDGGVANAAVPLSNGARAIFICFANGAWNSALLGAVSA